jgi:N6-L-threonylcarbamoyladenine synthase
VANNRTLQALLERLARSRNLPFLRAQGPHTGDNAGMIAFAAWMEAETLTAPNRDNGLTLEIAPSWPLAEASAAERDAH